MILLYKESLQDESSLKNEVISADYICVKLLQGYVDYPKPPYYYILEVTVKVDGAYVINKRSLLNESMFEAHPSHYYIRMAIEKYDSLLATHPRLQDES